MTLNACEIDYLAERRHPGRPHLESAARYLKSFKDLLDDISDGWPYWNYGRECSEYLQEVVRSSQFPAVDLLITPQRVTAAQTKIRSFLQRCKQTRERPEVQQWLRENPT